MKDYYLYSITINPKKPAEKKCYSEKDLRDIANDLKQTLGAEKSKVAIVFSVSNLHLSSWNERAKNDKDFGIIPPKVFSDWHIHASMLSFDYDEIERATTLLRDFFETRFEPLKKFPTLLRIAGYNCQRSKEEQESLGYHWYENETGNTDFYFIYQKEQEHSRAIIYNGTDMVIKESREFERILLTNNMINFRHKKGSARLKRKIENVKQFCEAVNLIGRVVGATANCAYDKLERAMMEYKKTGSEETWRAVSEEVNAFESLVYEHFGPLLKAMGYKQEDNNLVAHFARLYRSGNPVI